MDEEKIARIEAIPGRQVQLDVAGRRKFALIKVSDIELTPIEWTIQAYLESESIGCLYGDPEGYKTFVALDMSCCCGAGIDWHEHPTKRGPVIYIAGEGQRGIRRRVEAWCVEHGIGIDELPLYVSKMPADFVDAEHAAEVCEEVKRIVELTGTNPVMVVIDTLARNMIGDENSTRDINAFVAHLDIYLKQVFHCVVLFIQHCGHSEKGRPRGAHAITGNADATLLVKRGEGTTTQLIPGKMKDAERPPPLAFELKVIDLGYGTSCVLRPTTLVDEPDDPSLGANQRAALQILARMRAERRGNLLECGRPDTPLRTEVKAWREECAKHTPGLRDRRVWHELKASLQRRGLVMVENGFVEPKTKDVT